MDPAGIRKCMSLGYSSKKSNTTIGQCNFFLCKSRNCYDFMICLTNLLQNLVSDLVCCFYDIQLACVPDGNGFKTSTMRLGADAIVFTRAVRGGYFLFYF